MTMNQMQYFSTVCRYHNITKAAKILMISQPGLSARLSELEAEVGVKLLERTSKGVSPTEEGARLLAHVEAVLGRYRLLQNDLPAIAQGRSTVRVGFRPYSGEAEMIQLCRDFQQCFPETRVVFNEMRNVTPSLFWMRTNLTFWLLLCACSLRTGRKNTGTAYWERWRRSSSTVMP